MLEKCRLSGFADEIHADIEKQIKLLNQLGQKYIELRSANGKGIADYTMEEAMHIKEKLDAKGIKISAIGSPIGKILITDPFEPHYEKFKHVVSLAKLFETKYIRMFSFFIPQGENPNNYREEVFARIEKLVEYAKEKDVTLLHENEKDIYGDTAVRCYDLMNPFFGEHFKCTFDFANFIQCGQDTVEAYDMLKPYIEYIHVKDARMEDGEVVPSGQGDGQLASIFNQLDINGFQGFLSLEPHLSNFDGFNQLEVNVRDKKQMDGEYTYQFAYHCLKNILGQI